MHASVIICAATFIAGCNGKVIRVELPSGFAGTINITCLGVGENFRNVIVDRTGAGTADGCPKTNVIIEVFRDGGMVTPVDSVRWIRTDDGLPVSLEFTVR